jgi:hypothetical protein
MCGIDSWRRLNVSIFVLKSPWFIACLTFRMAIPTASHAQAVKPAPPTPIDMKKVELGGTPWNSQWDQIIEKALREGKACREAGRESPPLQNAIV